MDNFFYKKFNSFDELCSDISTLKTTKDRGDAFEDFIFAFLKINSATYNISKVYKEKDVPLSLRTKLKLEPTDNGVDGVFVDNNDKAVAYQSKFRSNYDPPTYRELATFLTESENADFRCTIANSYTLPSITDKKTNHFSLLYDTFCNLDDDFWTNLQNFALNNKIIKSIKTPFDYQLNMVNDVVLGLKNYSRGKLLAACGTGKTLTSLWITERLNCESILFVVPNLTLIKQTLTEWSKECSIPFTYLCVCSDSSVCLQEDEENANSITYLGFPSTTFPDDIVNFLSSPTESKKVIFSTYQSLDSISTALTSERLNSFSFNLTIFDEAHRTAGAKDCGMFAIGLDEKFIRSFKRLFMTATERVVSKRVKKALSETEYQIFSMDDESIYGPTFHTLTFGKAIELGIICDYKIVVQCINSNDYLNLYKKNRYISAKSLDVNSIPFINFTNQAVIAKCMTELNIKKIISYHHSIKSATTFVSGSPNQSPPLAEVVSYLDKSIDVDSLCAKTVTGEMPSSFREQIFSDFVRCPYGVLSNARCLTEGVDLPSIDGIFFADPKNSYIDIIQAVGRALRKSKLKSNEKASIILPIILSPDITNFENLDNSIFETIHNVIQALRDQDAKLVEIIDELNLYAAQAKCAHKPNFDGKINVILPEKINFDDFLSNLSLRIATFNKDPLTSKISYAVDDISKPRSSSFKRVFTTIVDMNYESYCSHLVIPTIEKFENKKIAERSKICFNHNNVSHTEKLGLIEKIDKTFYKLTDLGKAAQLKSIVLYNLFKRQLLYFNQEGLFPYRALLKLFLKIDSLSRTEFVYAVYTIADSGNLAITEALSRIRYLRETYPNIEIANDENKNRILLLLNQKYGVSFQHQDLWSSKTTISNQFGYFKNHLSLFEGFTITNGNLDFDAAYRKALKDLLTDTEFIESAENYDEIYKKE